jgi:hypothetical protein
MITDALATLSSAQVVTASAVSTNTIDLLQARDLGPGTLLTVYFDVVQAVTAAGAATVNFQIISSAAAALTSPTVIDQTDAIGKATLIAGFRISLPIARAPLLALGQRYLGVNYLVTTGPLTAGSFNSGVVYDYHDNVKAYPSGFTVS